MNLGLIPICISFRAIPYLSHPIYYGPFQNYYRVPVPGLTVSCYNQLRHAVRCPCGCLERWARAPQTVAISGSGMGSQAGVQVVRRGEEVRVQEEARV